MAIVTLRHGWINLVETGQQVNAPTNDRSDFRATAGEFQEFAGGRRRLSTVKGSAQTLGVTMKTISEEDKELLDSWRTRLILFRDNKGRKVFGAYLEVEVIDKKGHALYDVVLEIESVTYNEGA